MKLIPKLLQQKTLVKVFVQLFIRCSFYLFTELVAFIPLDYYKFMVTRVPQASLQRKLPHVTKQVCCVWY